MLFTMGRRYRVLSVRGIPFSVTTSWIAVVALTLYATYFRFELGTTPGEAIWLAALFVVLFFGGVIIHEGAHAAVARAFDLPVTGISLVFWGGATETRGNAKGPWVDLLVSFAGPASTLVLGGLLFVIGEGMGFGEAGDVIRELARWSLLFGVFNLVPAYPLDGGQMLRSITWGLTGNRRLGMLVAGWAGVAVGVGLIAFGFQRLVAGEGSFLGVWFAYIGFSVASSARRIPALVELLDGFGDTTVGQAMRPAPPAISATTSVTEAIAAALRDHPRSGFAVTDAGRVVGTITMDDAQRAGKRGGTRPVRDAMRPLSASTYLGPDERLADALQWLASGDVPVLRDGIVVGQLSAGDVESFYRRMHEPVPPRPDR
jgi:Zn-dependent protease/CBS domain-containing protein